MQFPPQSAFYFSRSSYFSIQQNETYSPKVEITNEGITSISHCLHRLFRVEGKKDIDKRKEREREDQSTTFGRKNAKDYY